MAQIFGLDTGVSVPSFISKNLGGTWTIILTIIIFAIVIAIGIYIYIQKKTFSKTIVLFENIAGQGYQKTYQDKARVVKIGDGGEELLFLKKKKVYRTAYGKKMGKNTYWFAVGQDGYWYNVLLGDLDAKMGMLDIEPVDRDMRYMHVAIRKNITERYKKITFMDKYGTWLMGGLFFLVMVLALWFLVNQIGDLVNKSTANIQASNELLPIIQKALSKVDQLCGGGSGIAAA
jgi:hypothetical protein